MLVDKAWISPSGEVFKIGPYGNHARSVINNVERIKNKAPGIERVIRNVEWDWSAPEGSDSAVKQEEAIYEIYKLLLSSGWIRVTNDYGGVCFDIRSWRSNNKKYIVDYLINLLKLGHGNIEVSIYVDEEDGNKIDGVSVSQILSSDLLEVSLKNQFSRMVNQISEEPKRKTADAVAKAKPVMDRPKTLDIVVGTPGKQIPGSMMKTGPKSVKVKSDAETMSKFSKHSASLSLLHNEIDPSVEVPNYTDDEDIIPEVPVQTDLPAVIDREMIRTGGRSHPKWYQVKTLPGYFQSAIKMIGKSVFKSFTNTRIEDIFVLSTLTNSDQELQLTASWVKKFGKKVTEQKIEFQELMPDYESVMEIWDVSGYQFALVKDFMGLYIYGWIPKSGKVFDPVKKKYIK